MDGRRRLLRTLKAKPAQAKPASGADIAAPVSRAARIAASRRRSARLRRFLARHHWVLPAVKVGAFALVLGGFAGWAVATDFPARVRAELTALMRETGFTVREVTITGRRQQSEESILAALDIPLGTALWQADLNAAHERISALPWVGQVAIERVAPDQLVLTITERRPVAMWQTGGRLYAIDAGGNVIDQIEPQSHTGLFHVVGEGAGAAAPKFFKVLYRHPEIVTKVGSAVYVGERRWDLHFDNHVVAELPEGDVASALQELERLITDEGLFDRAFDVIDLRDPDQIRLRGAERAAADMADKDDGDNI